eukprot:3736065-Lingulodinium_polyedra.AAC.1
MKSLLARRFVAVVRGEVVLKNAAKFEKEFGELKTEHLKFEEVEANRPEVPARVKRARLAMVSREAALW